MPEPFQWIETPDALHRMVARVRENECLALDTEFVWDRTYYARLGLIQIGLSDGASFLIDPLAVPDLSPLGEVLSDPSRVKILHDAPQDLMILRRATGRFTGGLETAPRLAAPLRRGLAGGTSRSRVAACFDSL